MIDLGPKTDAGSLDLREISDPGAGAYHRFGPDMAERADRRFLKNPAVRQLRDTDLAIIAYLAVFNITERADGAISADHRLAAKNGGGLDHSVLAYLHVGVDVGGSGVHDGHSRKHQALEHPAV